MRNFATATCFDRKRSSLGALLHILNIKVKSLTLSIFALQFNTLRFFKFLFVDGVGLAKENQFYLDLQYSAEERLAIIFSIETCSFRK